MHPRTTILLGAMLCAMAACAKALTPDGGNVGGGGGGGAGGAGGASAASSTSSSSSAGSSSTTSASSTSGGGGGGSSTSTTSSSSTSGASTSSSSSSSGGTCAESPCKLTLPQCGCAAGKECVINGAYKRACVVEGNVGPSMICDAANVCAPGLECLQVQDSKPVVATCAKFCDTDADCSAPGGLCLLTLGDAQGNAIPGATLCTENCDPSTNAGCYGGAGCQFQQEAMGQMRTLTRCLGSGAGGDQASCTTNADCLPTFGCFQGGGATDQCFKWCKVGGSCPNFQQCTGLGTPLLLGGQEYGVCQ